jgi:hypothetical protein
MTRWIEGSENRVSTEETIRTLGWSAAAELEVVGERWTMVWRVRDGVERMRGMWKTFADNLQGRKSQLLFSKDVVEAIEIVQRGRIIGRWRGRHTHSL